MTTVLIGLSLTQPSFDGLNITEPNWSSYTRSIQDLSTWANPSGSVYTNIASVTFPIANITANTYYYIPYFFLLDSGTLAFQGAGSVNPGATLAQNYTLAFGSGAFTFTYGTISFMPNTTNNAFPMVSYPAFAPTYEPYALGEPILYNRNMRS